MPLPPSGRVVNKKNLIIFSLPCAPNRASGIEWPSRQSNKKAVNRQLNKPGELAESNNQQQRTNFQEANKAEQKRGKSTFLFANL